MSQTLQTRTIDIPQENLDELYFQENVYHLTTNIMSSSRNKQLPFWSCNCETKNTSKVPYIQNYCVLYHCAEIHSISPSILMYEIFPPIALASVEWQADRPDITWYYINYINTIHPLPRVQCNLHVSSPKTLQSLRGLNHSFPCNWVEMNTGLPSLENVTSSSNTHYLMSFRWQHPTCVCGI